MEENFIICNGATYYIPELEEFYVGFEYEYLHDLGNDKVVWEKETYDAGWSFNLFKDYVNNSPERHRVKLLDKEDIEDLGWKYNSWSYVDGGDLIMEKDDFLLFKHNNNQWSITSKSQSVTLNNKYYHGYIFKGAIKNKSELKKLLKRLNIQ